MTCSCAAYDAGKNVLEPDLAGGPFGQIMQWANELRRLGVRTNADTPKDAAQARKSFGVGSPSSGSTYKGGGSSGSSDDAVVGIVFAILVPLSIIGGIIACCMCGCCEQCCGGGDKNKVVMLT